VGEKELVVGGLRRAASGWAVPSCETYNSNWDSNKIEPGSDSFDQTSETAKIHLITFLLVVFNFHTFKLFETETRHQRYSCFFSFSLYT
jgi:hypothetical protein